MDAFFKLARTGRLGPVGVHADASRIFERGEPATHAYYLEHGAVEIVQSGEQGAEVVVKILVGPALFGTIEILGDEAAYLESVRSLGAARVYRVARSPFIQLLLDNQRLALDVATDMSRAFCTAARFEPSRVHEADVLLANLLVAYADVFGHASANVVELRIKRTQDALAAAIGASERQVNRLISDWRDAGKLDKRAGYYVLLDYRFFTTLAAELSRSLVHGFAPTMLTLDKTA